MTQRLKVIGLVLLVVTLTLGQGTVPSAQPAPARPTDDQRLAAVPLVGRLEVHRGRTARVDNVDLEEGSTILDGQTVETSDCTSATVHLLPVGLIAPTILEVGQIDIAANSKVIVNYSAGTIKATIERGCARVRNASAISSSVVTLDGKVFQATARDNSNQVSADSCYPSNRTESYEPTCVPPIVWVVGGAGAATIGVVGVIAGTRGTDPSNDTPGGP